ncbi:MAG: tetratricopeptide repeat protein, partial [Myxococcota bacterium]
MLARESILPIEAPRSRRIRVRFLCLALGACVFFLSCGQSTESRLAESRSLQAAGQFAASIAPLRKALSEDADHPEANYLLGIALARTGQKSLAVWPLRKASESDDYGVLAGLILGSTLHVDQSLAEAVRAYSNVLQIDPENQVALVARGTAQINRGLPELALADADRLLELSPNLQSAILLRAAALLDLGRRDEAEELLVGLAEQATELDSPEAGRTCAGLALFYSDRRDSTRATETFERCLEQYPGDPMLQRMASEFFVNQSNPEKAIAVWRGAVDARPENLQPRVKLAQNLVEHGRGGEAEAVLREAVELFDSSQAWRELADFYREQKSPEKAREALEEAMQRSREVSSAARFALADL